MDKKASRFSELDALRGFAALGVVIFHFTEHGATHNLPLFEMKWGMHGVQLFFCISGFVIYWTLERSKTLMDFAVSRFSRLYPSYWATLAILAVVMFVFHGERPWLGGYVVNATMWQHLLGRRDLDVVYWTLGVELMFYVWMAGIFALKALDRIEWIAAGWLAIAAVLCCVLRVSAVPETIRALLIFEHIPFFLAGMMFYRIRQNGWTVARVGLIVLSGATTTILAEWHGLWVSLIVFGLFGLATAGWLRWIVNPVTTWLGTISYTLYLTHRAWGQSVMMELSKTGMPKWVALGCAIVAALLLATLVTKLVEQPAMALIRDAYRKFTARRAPAASVPIPVATSRQQSLIRTGEPETQNLG